MHRLRIKGGLRPFLRTIIDIYMIFTSKIILFICNYIMIWNHMWYWQYFSRCELPDPRASRQVSLRSDWFALAVLLGTQSTAAGGHLTQFERQLSIIKIIDEYPMHSLKINLFYVVKLIIDVFRATIFWIDILWYMKSTSEKKLMYGMTIIPVKILILTIELN